MGRALKKLLARGTSKGLSEGGRRYRGALNIVGYRLIKSVADYLRLDAKACREYIERYNTRLVGWRGE